MKAKIAPPADSSGVSFKNAFHALTGYDPFPWQESLYRRFLNERTPPSCTIPTGLGKTAVIAIWLIALAFGRRKDGSSVVPRRLVYVVNRRTVVDQSTTVVERIRERLLHPDNPAWAVHENVLRAIADRLRELAALDDGSPLAISTLRGQLADNAEWRSDPARPAVIIGTVDIIGSRLLFSGYRAGFKSRPLHAGFLGQDALIVHDEAHLEPAFQELLTEIQDEQREGRFPDLRPLRILELTATSRESDGAGDLTIHEMNPPSRIPGPAQEPVEIAWRRVKAPKALSLRPVLDEKQVTAAMVDAALEFKDSGDAILVYARTVDAVRGLRKEVATKAKIGKDNIAILTGTIRGLERDELVETPAFQRFLPGSNRNAECRTAEGTTYLICTSAGEVGVDISADHLICDLSTFESMAQRFGRVNRFGDRTDTRIEVVHPESFGKKDKMMPIDEGRVRTLELLRQLKGNASPLALSRLDHDARQAAFAPLPQILPSSDILFDAWAMTSIREKLPGRPPIEPYLHGIREWEPPETQVAWREEVDLIRDSLFERYPPDDLLDDYPLKPCELLRDTSERVFQYLNGLTEEPKRKCGQSQEERRQAGDRVAQNRTLPVWVFRPNEQTRSTTLQRLVESGRESIFGATLLLPPGLGGLEGGMLGGSALDMAEDYDVADRLETEDGRPARCRILAKDDEQPDPEGMRLVRRIDFPSDSGDEDEPGRSWFWFVRFRATEDASSADAKRPVKWESHTRQVTENARRIAKALHLPEDLAHAVELAAKYHDLGKRRELWQRGIGNPEPTDWHAKPGRKWRRNELRSNYRHEFGSILDLLDENGPNYDEFNALPDEVRDLVLHIVAAGHGRARPHFPSEEAYDPERSHELASEAAAQIPRRFARLQRKYGRWGLAYLESIVRAADWAASAEPREEQEEQS